VFDLNQTTDELRYLFEMEGKAQRSLESALRKAGRSPAFKDEVSDLAADHVENVRRLISKKLGELLRFPPQHKRHSEKLAEFNEEAPYEKSIFIMTKFPATKGGAKLDNELRTVIDAVVASINKCGYHARIASDKGYHAALWDNVELHLLGCIYGVAIVEDRYATELNPNVAMEWGWMRALGKEVLYLVEENFSHERADWLGLLRDSFPWDNPSSAIDEAVTRWLTGRGI
jgi:hypothetical protein